MSQAVAYSADVVELVDARDLKSLAFSMAYEFESRHPHHHSRLKIECLLHTPLQLPKKIFSFISLIELI